MKGLLGIKIGMTQIIEDDGTAIPSTLVQAGPCYVTQVKTGETDGYFAVQVGFGETKPGKLSSPEKGHLGLLKKNDKHPERKDGAGIPAVRHLREFRADNAGEYEIGQALTVEQFEVGQKVDVTGTSKGKGFQGVVKRYGFGGGPKTHGQSDRHRAPGSIGATSGVARVFKGKKMPGRMGNDRKTIQNLEIVRVDADRNLIAIKGALPGVKGGLVVIREAVKGR
jgi:large subunit ribosomal protein L3